MIRILKDGKLLFESENLYRIVDELIYEDMDVKEIVVTINEEALAKRDGRV